MKKLIAVLVIALVAAAAVWVVLRIQLAKRVAAVPELLPTSTLVLLEVPDFEKARADWHESDLYKIWREPAVQELLQKPLAQLPKDRGGRRILEEFLQLGPTHGFIALASLERNEPKLIGGFRFAGSQEKARQFISQRETQLMAQTRNARRETIDYEQTRIETVQVSHFVFASAYENQWYFASNDVAALKLLLDRVNHRREKPKDSLADNPAFAAAIRHLPREFAGMLFLDPRPFVEKLMPIVALAGQSLPMDQLQRLREVQSVASTIGFEDGKMRETDFVAMPQVGEAKNLKRPLLAAAGPSTFLYSASQVHWSDNLLASSAPAAVGLPALVQQFTGAMKARGISLDDLREGFGQELELVGDWPTSSPWPTLIAVLPVKDTARALKIAAALTSVELGGAAWVRSEHDGVTFFSAQPFGLIPVHPSIAVSDHVFLAGSDEKAIQEALGQLAKAPRELEKSATFHEASVRVPAAGSAFNYVDTRLLYERADAATRPLLLMGATFYPALAKTVDLSKLPPAEVITKHLSPIVMSQRYEENGYITESVGPVTFREATLGVAGAIGGMLIYLRDGFRAGVLMPPSPVGNMPATALPSVSPTPSPF
ncbi:MAG: hypothetical protein ABIR38_06250 [Chthoniobacterales bacterium]